MFRHVMAIDHHKNGRVCLWFGIQMIADASNYSVSLFHTVTTGQIYETSKNLFK